MSSQVITIRVDSTIKKKAQNTAEKLGLSLSTVLKDFLNHFIQTQSSILGATKSEIPSPYLIQSIKQARKDRKDGKASPIFKTAKEAVKWLEDQGI